MTIVAHPRLAVPIAAVLRALDDPALDVRAIEDDVEAAGNDRPCQQRDPEEYFPVLGVRLPKGDRKYIKERDRARENCAGCPVRDECLILGLLDTRGRFGIWGGTSEWERREIREAWIADRRAPATEAAA